MSKQLRKPVRTRRLGAVGALVVAAVVTAAGCSSGSSGTEQDESQPLEVWIRQDAGSPAAESAAALTKAFTEKSGIEAKLVAVGVNDFETKLQQRTAQKDLPDIVINDTGQLGGAGVRRQVLRGALQLAGVRPADTEGLAGEGGGRRALLVG
ncbi:hypothetical protein ACIQW4_13585 [Streptomyces albogriseolus]|uniref:hypothetical protein n=1 Tax=Streptomyces albogriseolus TaxID=1887 RepID=UPI003811C7E1